MGRSGGSGIDLAFPVSFSSVEILHIENVSCDVLLFKAATELSSLIRR